jgi:hypothetical protein
VPVVTQADGDVAAVARTYRDFGRLEARGRSAAYETLADTVRGLGATWLSSEPPGVVPGTDGPARDGHTCVLARDGRGIAVTESHATWLRWLG